jgi:hypothetical protein
MVPLAIENVETAQNLLTLRYEIYRKMFDKSVATGGFTQILPMTILYLTIKTKIKYKGV